MTMWCCATSRGSSPSGGEVTRVAFKRRDETDGTRSDEVQARLLKAQYAMIPNRRDPYRHEEMKRRGLVTKNEKTST
ncbi:hypothetical protein Tchar_02563 [Tepidimonas charontis]|uniref:Uncharacterized protein n=1 Tax=Tepidimonas charontis TaxID=2267262 RepID=A0A554X171_9BURK|nr:hypothetical protein Tchar_02563 [Tepidimonas charontis]